MRWGNREQDRDPPPVVLAELAELIVQPNKSYLFLSLCVYLSVNQAPDIFPRKVTMGNSPRTFSQTFSPLHFSRTFRP